MKKRNYQLCIVLLSLVFMGNSQAEKAGNKAKRISCKSAILKTTLNLTSEK